MNFLYSTSKSLFEQSQQSIPGGVNSPVRSFISVGGTPIFIHHAKGAYLYDEDNNAYIDLINSWGPMILGHAHEEIIQDVSKRLSHSFSFGTPTHLELEMALQIKKMVPSIDLIRMVNSGTEACMSAIRLARGYTHRNKIIKFEGCYHGHADSFLVNAGSGLATLSIQNVHGVTSHVAQDTLSVHFNDLPALDRILQDQANEIAAVIVEPVAGNMGCIPPQPDFLKGLRERCTQYGIILIFDEVMTGFRIAKGGAQEYYKVEADIVTFGKVIGGGMPVAAYGGKKHIMNSIAPVGKVYQAGTLSGNPIALQAGISTLRIIDETPSFYKDLNNKTTTLTKQMQSLFSTHHIPVQIHQVGSMMSIFFTPSPVTNFTEAKTTNLTIFKTYFHYCLSHGIYIPPSALESWFISAAIQTKELTHIISITETFLKNNLYI